LSTDTIKVHVLGETEVTDSMMPEGVEHVVYEGGVRASQCVTDSMMPEGVEHAYVTSGRTPTEM